MWPSQTRALSCYCEAFAYACALLTLIPLPGQAAITIAVRESTSLQPLADVEVLLEKPPSAAIHAKTVTDEKGLARFDLLEPGLYLVEVKKPGWTYPSLPELGVSTRKTIRLTSNSPTADLQFLLARVAQLYGVVVDAETREPVEGCMVMGWRLRYQRGQRLRSGLGGLVTTGPKGEFSLSHLVAGEYALQLAPELRGSKRVLTNWSPAEAQKVDLDYPGHFWPGGVDAAAVVPITVRAGEQVNAGKILAERTPHYRVRLRLAGAACEAEDKVRLQIHLANQTNVESFGPLPCRGEYLFLGFEPGLYGLRARLERPGGDLTGTALVEVGRTNPAVVIAARPGSELEVRLVTPDGVQPPARAAVRLRARPAVGGTTSNISAPIAAGGSARLAGVELEDQEISVIGVPSGYALRDVLYNGVRVPDRILRPNPLAPTHVVEIVLDDKPASLAGAVRQGDRNFPSPYVVLARWPVEGNIHTTIERRKGDEQGNFRFDGLPAGEYALAAIDFGLLEELEKPFVLQRLLADAEKFKLAPGQSGTANLKLTPIAR